MAYQYDDITADVDNGTGGILAAWFVAKLNGPVAFSIGYLEREERRDIFYAWHHWSGHKAIRIGDCSRDLDPSHTVWGEYLLCDMVRFGNAGLKAQMFDYRFFDELPAVLVTNGNPAIGEAFIDLATCSNAGRDWSRELFLINRYGSDLVRKGRWLVRSKLENLRGRENTDPSLIARVEADFAGKSGFIDWALPDLPPTFTTRDIVQQWAGLISKPSYAESALWRIGLMWVGAADHVGEEAWTRHAAEQGVMGFNQLADYFERYGLPLWPPSFNDVSLHFEYSMDRP